MNEPANPFEAPKAPIGPRIEPVRSSRWSPLRWIPAIACASMALFGLLLAFGHIGLTSYFLLTRGWSSFELMFDNPILKLIETLMASLFFGAGSIIASLSFRAWVDRRWKLAILLTLLVYPIMLPGGFLVDPSRHRILQAR